jgi:hypothetical protein
VNNNPEGEKAEMIEIYHVLIKFKILLKKNLGMDLDEALIITNTISKHKTVWVEVMMLEELGLLGASENPFKDSLAIFLSFCLF